MNQTKKEWGFKTIVTYNLTLRHTKDQLGRGKIEILC